MLRLGESAIVYAILDFVGDNYLPIVDKITEELATIEDDIFSTMPATEKIERIYRLRAGLLDMRHAISPMVEICNQLRRHDFAIKAAKIRPYLRDVHDHVLFVSDAIADLRERLTAAFEASMLLASARQNEIVKKLASWAAILAVPTMIAGIYGMNFKSMPELEWAFGYPADHGVDGRDLRLSLLPLQARRLALTGAGIAGIGRARLGTENGNCKGGARLTCLAAAAYRLHDTRWSGPAFLPGRVATTDTSRRA